MTRIPTWPVAAGSLILGFAVADVTDVRAIGGLVLFLGALWCGLRWRRARGLRPALALVALYLVAFAASHPLGRLVGAWPSVLAVAAVVGAVVWWRADRPGTDDDRGRTARGWGPRPLRAQPAGGVSPRRRPSSSTES